MAMTTTAAVESLETARANKKVTGTEKPSKRARRPNQFRNESNDRIQFVQRRAARQRERERDHHKSHNKTQETITSEAAGAAHFQAGLDVLAEVQVKICYIHRCHCQANNRNDVRVSSLNLSSASPNLTSKSG